MLLVGHFVRRKARNDDASTDILVDLHTIGNALHLGIRLGGPVLPAWLGSGVKHGSRGRQALAVDGAGSVHGVIGGTPDGC
jgi:hypothetical protein